MIPRKTKHIKTWTTVALAVLMVVIALQNTETVETKMLFASVSMPRAVLLFTTLAVGFILGLIVRFKFFSKEGTNEGA